MRSADGPSGRHRPSDEERAAERAAMGSYLTQGFQYAAVLLVFTGAGYWLDGRLHTLPWLTIVGAVIGGVGGFLHLYRSLTAQSRSDGDRT
jgi:F0F1-type ATP synthase assembly protein I